jgi:hypothetical protein
MHAETQTKRATCVRNVIGLSLNVKNGVTVLLHESQINPRQRHVHCIHKLLFLTSPPSSTAVCLSSYRSQVTKEQLGTNLSLNWRRCTLFSHIKLFISNHHSFLLYPFYFVDGDTVVCTATRYGRDGPGIESRRERDFSHPFSSALRPTQTPAQWVPGLFPGLKLPGRVVDHQPASSAEVKERVELYLCSPSGPSWCVLGWTLSLITFYFALFLYFNILFILTCLFCISFYIPLAYFSFVSDFICYVLSS